MSANMFTQQQILSGIRLVWKEALNYVSPIHPEMNFAEQFQAHREFADIDLSDVFYRLERTFGFKCSKKEWHTFLGLHITDLSEWEKTVAPRLTFDALAQFICERLKPISLEPITILGKPCLTAGVFRGLELLAEQIDPKVRKFAPSTPIRTRLRGFRLRCFWSKLQWIMEDQLPPPPQITLSSRGCLHSLLFKLSAGLVIFLWRRNWEGVLAGIVTTVFLFIPMGIIVALINDRLNPLPEGIETFGDLARVLAAIIQDQQTEAASCSTP
jgi:hypothetical protein